MNGWPALILGYAVAAALGMCLVGIMLSFVRLVLGPSLADRVVALDLIAMMSVGIVAVYDIYTEEPILLDAATVVALISFVGTVAFARYLVRRGHDE